MSFAAPIALTLLTIALPVIALYILKVRLRRVPVSTNLFWKQIYEEKPPRSIWQQFRHWLSLAMQLLFLLLLVLAIADPFFAWQSKQARRIVLIVDNSASMQATDVAPSRLDAAKHAATELIDGLRDGDQMAVVVAGTPPVVISGLSGHVPSLKRAIQEIPVTDKRTQLQAAIELGTNLVGDHPGGSIVVLTDGCVDTTELRTAESVDESSRVAVETNTTTPPQQPPITHRVFATAASNIGITQFQARRSMSDPLGYEILVSVRNASSETVSCRLELFLDDSPVDVLPLTMKPDELWTRSLEKTSLPGGVLRAELSSISKALANGSGGDGTVDSSLDQLAVDNTAWAVLPARVIQRVLIVSPGNLFLQKVFEANPLVEVSVVRDAPAEWPAGTIVVLHGQVPPVLPGGPVLAIDPIGDCDAWTVGPVIENPIITEQDKLSPLMTHIRLDNVVIPEARRLQFAAKPKPLATTLDGEPVYAEVPRTNGKCLVLSVNLDRSDLAFRTAFPILVSNALSWFAGQSGELQPALATGDMTTRSLRSPVAAEMFELRGPGETAAMLVWKTDRSDVSGRTEFDQQQALLGPFDHAGLWTVTARRFRADAVADSEHALATLAVNLANERESDLRPVNDLITAAPSPETMSRWFSRPLWFSLALLAAVLFSIEWALYQRRVIA